MRTEIEQAGHLTDGDVVRYADGEGAGEERAAWARHLAGCGRCTGEVRAYRSDDRLIAAWLDRAAFEAEAERGSAPLTATPDRRRPAATRFPGMGLRAAAVVLLAAGVLTAVPPVRAWVLDRVAPLVTSESGPAEAAGPAGEAPAAVDPQVLRFVPDSGPFVVAVDHPAHATVMLGRAQGPEAVLRADVRAEPVVSATGVRVAGEVAGEEGAGDLELRLPAQTTSVRLRLGGRELQVDGGQLDRGVVLSLDGAGRPVR